jgi:hypothetical protein
MNCDTEKEAVLAEIFISYREAGAAYKKTTNVEIRHMLLAIKHGLDLAIKTLLPIDDEHLRSLNELNEPFSN